MTDSSKPPEAQKGEDTKRARVVTLLGLAANIIIMALKFVAGTVGGSRALLADAVHGVSDVLTDIIVLVGIRYWSAPPDREHPYGHKRLEALVTVVLGLILTAAGIGIMVDAVALLKSETVQASPSIYALVVAILSVLIKELLYRVTVSVGRKIRSSAISANAWHHRSDALSSLPAAIAVAVALYVPNMVYVDIVGAMVVSFFIFHAAYKIMRNSLRELVDSGAPQEVSDQIANLASSVDGVDSVHAIRTRYLGLGLQIDMHLLVPPRMSVRDAHNISDEVTLLLKKDGPDVLDVVIHIEPSDIESQNKVEAN